MLRFREGHPQIEQEGFKDWEVTASINSGTYPSRNEWSGTDVAGPADHLRTGNESKLIGAPSIEMEGVRLLPSCAGH
jgi:hypothetical protein